MDGLGQLSPRQLEDLMRLMQREGIDSSGADRPLPKLAPPVPGVDSDGRIGESVPGIGPPLPSSVPQAQRPTGNGMESGLMKLMGQVKSLTDRAGQKAPMGPPAPAYQPEARPDIQGPVGLAGDETYDVQSLKAQGEREQLFAKLRKLGGMKDVAEGLGSITAITPGHIYAGLAGPKPVKAESIRSEIDALKPETLPELDPFSSRAKREAEATERLFGLQTGALRNVSPDFLQRLAPRAGQYYAQDQQNERQGRQFAQQEKLLGMRSQDVASRQDDRQQHSAMLQDQRLEQQRSMGMLSKLVAERSATERDPRLRKMRDAMLNADVAIERLQDPQNNPAQFVAAMYNLAKSNDEGGRLSDLDVEMVGRFKGLQGWRQAVDIFVTSRYPEDLKQALIDVAQLTKRRYTEALATELDRRSKSFSSAVPNFSPEQAMEAYGAGNAPASPSTPAAPAAPEIGSDSWVPMVKPDGSETEVHPDDVAEAERNGYRRK